jgi:hypothetical protein
LLHNNQSNNREWDSDSCSSTISWYTTTNILISVYMICEAHPETIQNNKCLKINYVDNILIATSKRTPDPGWNFTMLTSAWNSFLYKSLYSCDLWIVTQCWILKDECKTHHKVVRPNTLNDIPHFNYISIGRANNSFCWVEVQWSYYPFMTKFVQCFCWLYHEKPRYMLKGPETMCTKDLKKINFLIKQPMFLWCNNHKIYA